MCSRCQEVRKHVWHPHARLMLKQCARRTATNNARRTAIPPTLAEVKPDHDPAWVSLLGFVALGILFALAWIATP